MLNTLRNFVRSTKIIFSLINDEKQSPFKTTNKQKYLSYRRGFTSDKTLIYGYDKKTINDFVSDYHRKKSKKINQEYFQLFDNKLVTERLLNAYVKMPTSYFLLRKEKVTSLLDKELNVYNIHDVVRFVRKKSDIVLKPIYGGGGSGVMVVKYIVEEDIFKVNNKIYNELEFSELLKSLNNYLVTEFIKQSSYSSNLFSKSVNTIRVLTMIDPTNKEPFIAAAVQRVGSEKTQPTDNFGGGKGGISILIDKETGLLKQAITMELNGTKKKIYTHPDTQNKITNITIPHWDYIKESILKTIRKNPFLQYVGWDVVVTETGFAVIEINSFSGLTVFQVHQPINLYDARINEFYKHHKIT